MNRRQSAGWLAVISMLLAVNIIVQASRPTVASTVPGPGIDCPSDVDADGIVGITDFLQLLGDWGPCPSASVVAVMTNLELGFGQGLAMRIWSDNTLEVGVDINQSHPVWACLESFPHAGEWVSVEAPPLPPGAHPVAIYGIWTERLLVASTSRIATGQSTAG